MHLLFLISALTIASAQLTSKTQKLYSCDVTTYQGALYKKDQLLGDGRFRAGVETFDACGEQCLQYAGCKAVNFIQNQKLCGLLGSGLPNANADKSLYDRYPDSLHAVITCNRKPSGPVGCGTQAAAYKPTLGKNVRIIGGSEAKPHSWPWLTHMFIDFKNGMGAGCGASLLRIKDGVEKSDIVITAAHCVTEEKSMGTVPKGFPANQISVTAGEHRPDRYDDGEETKTASEVRFHPKFLFTSTTGAVNDIAIVKLATPFEFSDFIRPICLSAPGEAIPVGKTCVAAGWGRNNSKNQEETPDTLQQVLAPAQDAKTCLKGWGPTYKDDIHICAGSLTGTSGTCQGDSGGMLACQQNDGSWRLYGATSFGVAGSCLQAGMPSVFARLSGSLRDWIDQNVAQMTSIK